MSGISREFCLKLLSLLRLIRKRWVLFVLTLPQFVTENRRYNKNFGVRVHMGEVSVKGFKERLHYSYHMEIAAQELLSLSSKISYAFCGFALIIFLARDIRIGHGSAFLFNVTETYSQSCLYSLCFELCPSANWFLLSDLLNDKTEASAPIDFAKSVLLSRVTSGLPFTINTDNPGIINTTIAGTGQQLA